MDDELLKLESELRSLRPLEPSQDLRNRLGRAFSGTHSIARPFRWSWLALPIAAGLAIAFVADRPVGKPPAFDAVPASPTAFKPIAAENLLLDSRDEGYVTLSDGTPAHRSRDRYLDTITWKDPETNASLTWSVPREEVRVVPVAFQ